MNPLSVLQWIVGGIGAVFFAAGLFLFSYYSGASEWPQVPAEVTKSEIFKGFDEDRSVTYEASVDHSYEAEGRVFQKTFRPNHDKYDRKYAQEALKSYQVGETFMIRYKPGNPSAYSLPDSNEEILGPIFTAIGFGMLIIALIVWYIKKRIGPIAMKGKSWEKEITFGD